MSNHRVLGILNLRGRFCGLLRFSNFSFLKKLSSLSRLLSDLTCASPVFLSTASCHASSSWKFSDSSSDLASAFGSGIPLNFPCTTSFHKFCISSSWSLSLCCLRASFTCARVLTAAMACARCPPPNECCEAIILSCLYCETCCVGNRSASSNLVLCLAQFNSGTYSNSKPV